jgi:hypothetical protein
VFVPCRLTDGRFFPENSRPNSKKIALERSKHHRAQNAVPTTGLIEVLWRLFALLTLSVCCDYSIDYCCKEKVEVRTPKRLKLKRTMDDCFAREVLRFKNLVSAR